MSKYRHNEAPRGKQCDCSGCGERFSGLSTFDAHRTGPGLERHCLTMFHLSAQGWTCRDGTWRMPISKEKQEQFRRLHRG